MILYKTVREVFGISFKIFIQLFIEGEEQELLSFFPGQMPELGYLVMQKHIGIKVVWQEKCIGIMDIAVQDQSVLPTEQICQVFPESCSEELDLCAVPADGDIVIREGHGSEPFSAIPVFQNKFQRDQIVKGDGIQNIDGKVEISLSMLFSDGIDFSFCLTGRFQKAFGIASIFLGVAVLNVDAAGTHPGVADVIAQGKHVFIRGIREILPVLPVEVQIVGKTFMQAFQIVIVSFQGDAEEVRSCFNQNHGVFSF